MDNNLDVGQDILDRVKRGERVTIKLKSKYRAKTGLTFMGFIVVATLFFAFDKKIPVWIPIMSGITYVLLFIYDYWLSGMFIAVDKKEIIQAESKTIRMAWSEVREIRTLIDDDSPTQGSSVTAIFVVSKEERKSDIMLQRYDNLEAIANTISTLTNIPIISVYSSEIQSSDGKK